MSPRAPSNFHGYIDEKVRAHRVYHPKTGWTYQEHSKHTKTEDRKLSYRFSLHAHPFVPSLVSRLVIDEIPGLLGADIDYELDKDGQSLPLRDDTGKVQKMADGSVVPRPVLFEELFSKTSYEPGPLVEHPYPAKDLDFSSSGAYSVYNWELFYHVPMTIAVHLSQNQRFEAAQKWFHYVFDPTDDSDGPTPERFWKVRPFQCTDMKMVEQVLVNLATSSNPGLAQETISAIDAWKNDPFQPFLVARYRPSAFQFKAVMAYLDNLIAWGDSLFLQYTGESINEAAQIYILAANILGPRPQVVPNKSKTAPQTYASLRAHMDAFGNAMVDLETEIPFHNSPHPRKAAKTTKMNSVSSVGHALFFCTPQNEQMLQYWDTVGDRLFKIHNSLNIEGVFQRVPLFDPPIDPALLVRAAAEGLDIADIVAGINQPLPLVRFTHLLQKATEVCQEVKTLGGSLLAAIEKKDNEALSVLRAKHETTMLQLAEMVKYAAYQEAKKNLESLQQSLANAKAKYTYYQRLQGAKGSDIKFEKMAALDLQGLNKLQFESKEPEVSQGPISFDYSNTLDTEGGIVITQHEKEELDKQEIAHGIQMGIHVEKALATTLKPIPDSKLALHFWGIGGDIDLPGGTMLSDLANLAADIAAAVADQYSYEAGKAGKVGGFATRLRDYQFQANAAAGEITQLYKQIRAAEIREAMAERDWKNHQKQIAQSQAIDQFLTDKPSNQALYTWMKREVKGLYNSSFQFAFEIAKKAEIALQQELGDQKLSYIQFGYLSGKEGLLAGERLYYDIKRMEMAYVELNRREYELTKHVSLIQVNPLGLLQLRATGSCSFDLPEEIFDFDGPGHYFRRIRSVAVSVPCVVGPYTSLNCRLTLAKSAIRTSTSPGENGYARAGSDDPRFSEFSGAIQSIVTSSGQNDSGLFETNLHDERKLPFEWSGAISQWQLDLPSVRTFDYDTISDVILHIGYTAREGGDDLKKLATGNLEDLIGSGKTTGSVRLLSMRHEFPSDWAKLKAAAPVARPGALAPLTFTIRPEHYPYWSQGRLQAVLGVMLYAKSAKDLQVSDAADGTGNTDSLSANDALGGLRSGSLKNIALPAPTGPWAFYFNDNSMDDLWFAVAWGKQS
jgi:hypothetical protein